MTGSPQGERLARIETLLETMDARLIKIEEHLTQLDASHAEDKADLAALRNKGLGVFAVVGLGFSALGVMFDKLFGSIFP